jgi:hypothetical protein
MDGFLLELDEAARQLYENGSATPGNNPAVDLDDDEAGATSRCFPRPTIRLVAVSRTESGETEESFISSSLRA